MAPTAKSAQPKQPPPTSAKHKGEDEGAPTTKRVAQANLITTLKRVSQDPQVAADRKKLLDFYQSLPRMSEEKEQLLQKWQQDKSCRWVRSYLERQSTTLEVARDGKQGWGTIFQLADLLKMRMDDPVQKELVEKIAAGLPHDMDWDEENPIERAYKQAELVRYNIAFNDLSSMKLQVSKSAEREDVLEGAEAFTGAGSSTDDGTPLEATMKEEPKEPSVQGLLDSLRKLDMRLGSSANELRRTKAHVVSKTDQDAERRAAELQKGIDSHFATHDKLLKWLASVKDDYDVKEAQELQDEVFAHLEAALSARKRCQHWLQSLSG